MDFKLTSNLIDYVLRNLDPYDKIALLKLTTRLEIAKNVVGTLHSWDAEAVFPLIFAEEAAPVISEEAAADAE